LEKEIAMDIATWTEIIGWGIVIIVALISALFALVIAWLNRQEKTTCESQHLSNKRHEAILDKLSNTNAELGKLSTIMSILVQVEIPGIKTRLDKVEDRLNHSQKSYSQNS